MMNEMDVRKKMLEELMGQMDDRMMGRLPSAAEPVAGEKGNLSAADVEAFEDPNEDDELTRKLRQASMR